MRFREGVYDFYVVFKLQSFLFQLIHSESKGEVEMMAKKVVEDENVYLMLKYEKLL
jgi:hypothetical protein